MSRQRIVWDARLWLYGQAQATHTLRFLSNLSLFPIPYALLYWSVLQTLNMNNTLGDKKTLRLRLVARKVCRKNNNKLDSDHISWLLTSFHYCCVAAKMNPYFAEINTSKDMYYCCLMKYAWNLPIWRAERKKKLINLVWSSHLHPNQKAGHKKAKNRKDDCKWEYMPI